VIGGRSCTVSPEGSCRGRGCEGGFVAGVEEGGADAVGAGCADGSGFEAGDEHGVEAGFGGRTAHEGYEVCMSKGRSGVFCEAVRV
jgi:hypothetical protein